jgi:hypothetical protein
MARVGIDSEFIVAASEVLDEGVPSTDHLGRTKLFQSTHRPQPGLEPTVIGFDGIIGVLLGEVTRSRDGTVALCVAVRAWIRSVACSIRWLESAQ